MRGAVRAGLRGTWPLAVLLVAALLGVWSARRDARRPVIVERRAIVITCDGEMCTGAAATDAGVRTSWLQHAR